MRLAIVEQVIGSPRGRCVAHFASHFRIQRDNAAPATCTRPAAHPYPGRRRPAHYPWRASTSRWQSWRGSSHRLPRFRPRLLHSQRFACRAHQVPRLPDAPTPASFLEECSHEFRCACFARDGSKPDSEHRAIPSASNVSRTSNISCACTAERTPSAAKRRTGPRNHELPGFRCQTTELWHRTETT